MKINTQYNLYNKIVYSNSFGAAKDINLKYIYAKRLHLLPDRMKRIVSDIASGNTEFKTTLRDLHLAVYSPLLNCKNLNEAAAIFPEFSQILELNTVIQRDSSNLRKIKEKMPLSEFSIYILKERWGKLKTINEIADNLGLKNRSSLSWFMEITKIPDLGKNYQALLKASDEELNRQIAAKTRTYNQRHYDDVLRRNRILSEKNRSLNSFLSRETWSRMARARELLSEISSETTGAERFGVFWQKYPQYAKQYGETRHIIAEEMKNKK